jgi:hypothetical protein
LVADDLEEAVQFVLVGPFASVQQKPHQLRQRQLTITRERLLPNPMALQKV